MSDLSDVFNELKAVLARFAPGLEVKADSARELSLDTRHVQKNRKPLFFGAVQMKKNYVSFHLMPVYVEPALLDSISPALKTRMQGKSCFNFKAADRPLFRELATLTEAGFKAYKEKGFV